MGGSATAHFLRLAQEVEALVATPDALIAQVEAQVTMLRFERIEPDIAWSVGTVARDVAETLGLPVAIEITLGELVAFQAALPGATAVNDVWARRKGAVVDLCGAPSLLVGLRFDRDRGCLESAQRRPLPEFAPYGGAFPLSVATGAVAGHVAVSGLPSIHDHALAVAAIRAVIARRRLSSAAEQTASWPH